MAIKKQTLKLMKDIYKLLDGKGEFKERSLAGLCFDLGIDYKKRRKVVDCIDRLTTSGLQITERETSNNIYFGVLPSPLNNKAYKAIFN